MVRTQRPVVVFQIFTASALADMSMESSWETATARICVRCPGASRPNDRSAASGSPGVSRTASSSLFESATRISPVAGDQAMEIAFAARRWGLNSRSSSAALAAASPASPFSPSAPDSASSSSAASPSAPAFFCFFACARLLRLFCRRLTSASPCTRNISKVLPAPWHNSTSKSTAFGRTNCNAMALPCPFGLGSSPNIVASGSSSLPVASGASAQSRRNLSEEPAASRVRSAFRASDQTSHWCSAIVCKQICVSRDQIRITRSLDELIRRPAAASVPAPARAADASGFQNSTAVT
mmetsp:Transcript_131459/g.380253  ORF Transcript_131459/g.380253 Transcript_131459/m.380253 type:complete len:296 (+) Transcript_131459:1449-2336(+)